LAIKTADALNDRALDELKWQRMTAVEPPQPHYLGAEYFCIECWSIHDFYNSYDCCAECATGDVVLVWPDLAKLNINSETENG